ncbi:glycosyltransferase [Patescibacteria group bacterium]
MRIIFGNKYYYLKGGAERHLFDLQHILEENGHAVIPFAMADERNRKTDWNKYFVSPVQTEKVRFSLGGLKTAGRMIYSCEAKRKFRKLIKKAKPDLVHIHNIYHQLSPSFLPVAKKHGVPVVMTAHDYKLVSPNYSMYHDGEICEHAKGDVWKAYTHRCVKGSAMASWLVALEMSLHKRWGLYEKNIDRILLSAEFCDHFGLNLRLKTRLYLRFTRLCLSA